MVQPDRSRTVGAYVGELPDVVRARMQVLRPVVRSVTPGGGETISRRMPTSVLAGRPLVDVEVRPAAPLGQRWAG